MEKTIEDLVELRNDDLFLEKSSAFYSNQPVIIPVTKGREILKESRLTSTDITASKENPYKILGLDFEEDFLCGYIEVYKNFKLWRDVEYGGISLIEIEGEFFTVEIPTPMEAHSSLNHPELCEEMLVAEGHSLNLYGAYKDLVNEINF